MTSPTVAQRLSAEHAATVARIVAMTADLDAMIAATAGANLDDEHDPEGSTVAFERAQLVALRERAQAHLVELDAAQARLRAGRYGICVRCAEPIARARLQALPAAPLCVRCAQGHRRDVGN